MSFWHALLIAFLIMLGPTMEPYLEAQQNGNLPSLVSSTANSDIAGPNVTSANDLVVGCFIVQTGNACPQSFTLTDTNGVIPSITMGTARCITNGDPNNFDNNLVVQQWWGVSTSSGTIALSPSPAPPRLAYHTIAEYSQGTNLTLDAQNNSGGIGTTNPSISATSTVQNDLAAVCLGTGDNPFTNFPSIVIPSSQQFAGTVPGAISDMAGESSYFLAGAAGTQTASFLGGGGTWGMAPMITLFKPTSLIIGSTLLPEGGKNTAYYAKLQAYGGVGAYTWTITAGSLQTGLSLNASTGEITGTPTASGNNSITFHVVGATSGSASATLSLNIGSALQTILVRSSCTFSAIGVGPCSPSAQAGDTIDILYMGDDTHGTMAWQVPLANITDNCGDVYYRMPQTVGVWNGAILVYTAKVTCSGNLSISYNGLNGDPLAGVTVVFAGGQPLVDDLTVQQSTPGNVTSTTLSTSFTTQVPNMKVLSVAFTDCGTGAGCAASTTTSGFVSLATANTIATFSVYSQDIATASSVSATTSFTAPAGMSANAPLMAMIGIRPAASTGALPAGEKIRRRMN